MNDQITFKALNNVSNAQIASNRKVNRARGIPKVGTLPVKPRLAIVGGGPDLGPFVDELKCFDGDIWAINGAYKWCKSSGIDATFYGIDPSFRLLPLVRNVHKAVLADTVHQSVFENLGAKVIEIAWTGPSDIKHSTTAAATAPMIAAERGHRHVTFYGCQSSFTAVTTHMYKNDALSKIWIKCGDVEYVSCPQFIMQAEFLAGLVRGLPKGLAVRGQGFLSSLIEHGTFEVTHVTKSINEGIEKVNQ